MKSCMLHMPCGPIPAHLGGKLLSLFLSGRAVDPSMTFSSLATTSILFFQVAFMSFTVTSTMEVLTPSASDSFPSFLAYHLGSSCYLLREKSFVNLISDCLSIIFLTL